MAVIVPVFFFLLFAPKAITYHLGSASDLLLDQSLGTIKKK
jgi:hypothetical protein